MPNFPWNLQGKQKQLLTPAIEYGFVAQKAHHQDTRLPFATIEAFGRAVRQRLHELNWQQQIAHWTPPILRAEVSQLK